MKIEALLDGAFDIHVHADPDVIPRVQSINEIAREATEAGLAGLLIKEHTTSTVGRCQALNRTWSEGLKLFSAVALNPPVGGLNPCAVESALKAGVDMVYFPTYGAANHVARWGAGQPPTAFPLPKGDFLGLTVSDRSGGLKEEALEILDLIARYKGVLATGHLAPEESLALLRAARQRKIKHLVVTHASESVTPFTLEQQAEAVALGAVIEHCFFAVTESCPDRTSLAEMADQIRQTGVEKAILSSDFGQEANGPVIQGLAHYLAEMQKLGFSDEELRTMIVDNPRRLLVDRG
ncbi:MAG: amidohydrolase [Deltaproteobacteria bacterium]|nr:amidohydrolase [Deltaproteobacteria bacterium]